MSRWKGFYAQPWSQADTLQVMGFMAHQRPPLSAAWRLRTFGDEMYLHQSEDGTAS